LRVALSVTHAHAVSRRGDDEDLSEDASADNADPLLAIPPDLTPAQRLDWMQAVAHRDLAAAVRQQGRRLDRRTTAIIRRMEAMEKILVPWAEAKARGEIARARISDVIARGCEALVATPAEFLRGVTQSKVAIVVATVFLGVAGLSCLGVGVAQIDVGEILKAVLPWGDVPASVPSAPTPESVPASTPPALPGEVEP